MSGDFGLRIAVPASLQALREDSRLHLLLVGDETALRAELQNYPDAIASPRIQIVSATESIAMDASVGAVLRSKPHSSMHIAYSLLVEGRAQALVSAGNTAALMALGLKHLGILAGFSRPAYCSMLPVLKGCSYMLDLGANIDCSAQQLHDFARMGAALVSALEGKQRPTVALLSNGSEPGKGNAVIKQAALLLAADESLNYRGFVEGSDLHRGEVEVIVCDGLLGNVALKTAEGTAALVRGLIAQSLGRRWWYKLLTPLLGDLRYALSGDRHGGAFLLGLQGVVVKSHGGSSVAGFAAALKQAAQCVEQQMLPGLTRQLSSQE